MALRDAYMRPLQRGRIPLTLSLSHEGRGEQELGRSRIWRWFPEFFDDLWDEKRKDKEDYREKNLERKQLTPLTAGPNLFQGSDEESKYESSNKDAQAGPCKIIPESYLRDTHSEIHNGERKIDQS